MVTLGISEILSKVDAEKDVDKKVELLRKNNSTVLQDVLRLPFDKNLKWLLPEGMPPIKEAPDGVGIEGSLYNEWKRLYLFFPGNYPPISQLKREQIFVQILEGVAPNDAKLLCAIKDKKMPYKSVTKALVEKAFPGLIKMVEEKNG